jgi:hypothetical protein
VSSKGDFGTARTKGRVVASTLDDKNEVIGSILRKSHYLSRENQSCSTSTKHRQMCVAWRRPISDTRHLAYDYSVGPSPFAPWSTFMAMSARCDVLIVEDNVLRCDEMADFLHRADLTIEKAYTGA